MVSSRVASESITWRVRSPSNAGSKTYLKGGEGRGGEGEGEGGGGGGVDVDCILIVKHSVYADSQDGQIDNGREGQWDRRQETGTDSIRERISQTFIFHFVGCIIINVSCNAAREMG